MYHVAESRSHKPSRITRINVDYFPKKKGKEIVSALFIYLYIYILLIYILLTKMTVKVGRHASHNPFKI